MAAFAIIGRQHQQHFLPLLAALDLGSLQRARGTLVAEHLTTPEICPSSHTVVLNLTCRLSLFSESAFRRSVIAGTSTMYFISVAPDGSAKIKFDERRLVWMTHRYFAPDFYVPRLGCLWRHTDNMISLNNLFKTSATARWRSWPVDVTCQASNSITEWNLAAAFGRSFVRRVSCGQCVDFCVTRPLLAVLVVS